MTHYTSFDYKSKKALKADVKRRNELKEALALLEPYSSPNDNPADNELQIEFNRLSLQLAVREATPWGFSQVPDGRVFPCGPHYPRPHKWYAEGEAKDGILISVK